MNAPWRITVVGVAVLLAVQAVAAGCGLAVLGADATNRRAVAFAAAVAGSGAVAGWIVSWRGRGRPGAAAVAGGLAATLVRMVPLLVALAWLVGRDRSPWAGPAGGLLVVFHLTLLAADLLLHSLADHRVAPNLRPAKTCPPAGADVTN